MLLKYLCNFVLFIFVINTLSVTTKAQHVLKCNANFSNAFSNAFRFHLPYADMLVETKYKVLLRQDEQRNSVFVFHGHEMYQMLVSRESKRLIYLGNLNGNIHAEHILDVQLIYWRNYWLLVVAAAEQLEIYQLPLDKIQAQSSLQAQPNLLFAPIQQIMLHGKYQRMFLTLVAQQKIMLLIGLNETQINSKISTFHWSNTYFDAIEEFNLPTLRFIDLIGNNIKYVVVAKTAKQQQKLVLTIYQIDAKSLYLKLSQTLNLNSQSLHASTFQGRSFIISCATKNHKCYVLRRKLMKDAEQFSVFKTHNLKDLNFQHFRVGNNFMLGVNHYELRLFANLHLDCYHSFVTNETDVNQLLIHVNAQDVNFVLLQYNRPDHTLIRFVEVEIADKAQVMQINQAEELDVGTRQQHLFEHTIGRLRSILLRRREAMQVFQQIDAATSNKLSHVSLEERIHIEQRNIAIVRIVDDTLLSPAKLMQRIEQMRYRVKNRRIRRSLDQNATVPGLLNVRKLNVKNLIYNSNILNNFHLENNTQSSAILSIRSNVTTDSLNTPELLTRHNYKPPKPPIQNSTNLFNVTNLNVQRINNMSWTQFYENVYLKNRDKKIEGRLIFQSDLKLMHLQTPLLNGQLVQQLFNLKKPQIIQSDIMISAFFVSDLRADKINGLNFAEDIVFSGANVTLQTPVKMHKLSIAGDIVFPQHLKLRRSNEIKQLQQQYNGEVIINGSLTLQNLATESSQTEIWLNTLPLMLPLYKKLYLLNSTKQHFEFPVSFGNAKISAESLESEFLNDQPIEQHLLSTTYQTKDAPAIFLVFKSAEIAGNLFNTNSSASQILKLNQTVARIGEVSNITGFKQFTSELTIENLHTLQLNDIEVSDLVRKQDLSNNYVFNATKKFKNIIATGKVFVQQQLNATLLNSFKLQDLLNYDYYFESLTVPHMLQAASVAFHKINDISFDDIFNKFHIRAGNELVLQKTLIVQGNATFDETLYLQEINNINWQQYQATLVLNNQTQLLIEGEKVFLDSVIITNNLKTEFINNMQLQQLFKHMLSKSTMQQITGIYRFGNLHATNVLVETINTMSSKALIDTQSAQVIIDADIIVPSLTVYGNASAAFEHNFAFSTLATKLQQLLNMNWPSIKVYGDVSWPPNSTDQLQRDKLTYVYKHAVRHNAEQIITGNIHLINPIIHNMQTKSALLKNIDLEFIFSDCLWLNHSSEQIIIAPKTFNNLQSFYQVQAEHLLNVRNLNEIDIMRFDAALYRKSHAATIKAQLKFNKTPFIHHLQVFGSINGLETGNIYQLGQPLPSILMHNLYVLSDLQIEQFNSINLNVFLETRVKKHAKNMKIFGHLSFENLIINKALQVPVINNISLNNLVFKNSSYMQHVNAEKQILGKLRLEGPVHIMHLNDKDLMQSYLSSLAAYQNVHFDILTVQAADFDAGLIMLQPTETPIVAAKAEMLPCSINNYEQLTSTLAAIENNLSKDLLYLDYDKQLNLIWQEPNVTIPYKLHELQCAASCMRQLLLTQLDLKAQNLYLSYISSNAFNANVSDVFVKLENDCANMICNIAIEYNNQTVNYMLQQQYALNMKLMQFNNDSIFIMLQVNNMLVRIFKYDKKLQILQDWQNVTTAVKSIIYNEFNHNYWLFAANQSALTIYAFEPKSQIFQLQQIIKANYDIVRSINMHLILSCKLCKQVEIYIYDQSSATFKHLQLIELKTQVHDVLAFNLNNKNSYLLVLTKQQRQLHYQLYKYAYIENWIKLTAAYFNDVQMALPLLGDRMQLAADKNLFLLCNTQSVCNIIKAFV